MPTLIGSLLKDMAKQFLQDNEIKFPEAADKDELIKLIRNALIKAGVNPELYDFTSRRELVFVQDVKEPKPMNIRRDLGGLDPFDLEPTHTAAPRWNAWLKRFDIWASAAEFKTETKGEATCYLPVQGWWSNQ